MLKKSSGVQEPSMTSLVCSDPSKIVCSDPPRMVCSDPYKVGGSLQTVLEGSLQTKDVQAVHICQFRNLKFCRLKSQFELLICRQI